MGENDGIANVLFYTVSAQQACLNIFRCVAVYQYILGNNVTIMHVETLL